MILTTTDRPSVLALDLAMNRVGVACPDGSTCTWDWTTLKQPDRLPHCYDTVTNAVVELEPDLVVVEDYAYAAKFAHSHELGEIGGVARLALIHAEQPWVPVLPNVLKMTACGAGNSSKDAVFAAAIRRLGYTGASKDEADALWLQVTVLAALGWPTVDLPAAHRRSLGKIVWPSPDLYRRLHAANVDTLR